MKPVLSFFSSPFRLLMLASALLLLPWLGLTDFNTKGEPREAIVATAMIDSGQWTLAYTNGGEMAFKPPFFHWCIALFSLPAGHVTEYTSRLPSALAALAMLAGCCLFFSRSDRRQALLATAMTITTFEVHRAATNCRVDMVLTACMVGALLCLYRWQEGSPADVAKPAPRRKRCWLLAAIVLMSAGTLTKGPVAILLPCGVAGAWMWLRGRRFFYVVGTMACVALASCLLPACWYWAAWRVGGDDFLALVREENIDRFLGKMSYESHVNPWHYNVKMLLAGFLPWTLAALFGLASVRWSRPQSVPAAGRRCWQWLRTGRPVDVYATLAATLMFLFYCIPASKRSVYILPCYPFLAWLLSGWLLRLWSAGKRSLRLYGHVLAALGVVLFVVLIAVRTCLVPDSLFGGRHAAEQQAMMHALRDAPWWAALPAIVPLVAAYVWWCRPTLWRLCLLPAALLLALDAFFQPTVLHVKSDISEAQAIEGLLQDGERLDALMPPGSVRYYTINFYLDNRVDKFDPTTARQGWLLVGEQDADEFLPQLAHDYVFSAPVYESTKRSCDTKQRVKLLRYRHR